jgi:catechol 2,3-dioxygenase-like lactoylglutathione lyase family enzyme
LWVETGGILLYVEDLKRGTNKDIGSKDIFEMASKNSAQQLHFIRRFLMSYRFHHVHIVCKDLDKMVRFFTEALEAKLIDLRKFGTADGASLDLNGTTVNLRVAKEGEEMAGDASQSTYGYDHIGLEVEDIETAFKDLKARGFSFFMPPTDIPNLKIAFFKGPEDITVELCQPA